MTTYSNSTSIGSENWWLRSPYYPYYSYYQPFSGYKARKQSKKYDPPKEEIRQMTDEEFDAALNNLLFGGSKQEGENV